MFSVITKIARVIFGGIAIIMVVVALMSLVFGILTIIMKNENPKLLEMAFRQVTAGAIMLLVGFPLFGVCAGALKRPLYFLVPIILIISFVLAGILLPESMQGIKGEGAGLGALAITIMAFRLIKRYYSKREETDEEWGSGLHS